MEHLDWAVACPCKGALLPTILADEALTSQEQAPVKNGGSVSKFQLKIVQVCTGHLVRIGVGLQFLSVSHRLIVSSPAWRAQRARGVPGVDG